jgi:hypothetical protein
VSANRYHLLVINLIVRSRTQFGFVLFRFNERVNHRWVIPVRSIEA